jgi:hypothetical protein
MHLHLEWFWVFEIIRCLVTSRKSRFSLAARRNRITGILAEKPKTPDVYNQLD